MPNCGPNEKNNCCGSCVAFEFLEGAPHSEGNGICVRRPPVNAPYPEVRTSSPACDEYIDNRKPIEGNEGCHSQLVGFLSNICRQKDVINFSSEKILALAEATDALRQPQLVSHDVKLVIKQLNHKGVHIQLPFSMDEIDEEQPNELDQLIDFILGGKG